MKVIINHNVTALNMQMNMANNQMSTSKSLEKLSSGMRINQAGDDVAGLAISEKMRGQIFGLGQAERNSADGISLLQTAEGALSETHSLLQRMRELAVQSASDTYTNRDRVKLQAELDQLISETNRITANTSFNTQNLLDGTFDDKKIQVGSNQDQSITLNFEDMGATALKLAETFYSGGADAIVSAPAGNSGITESNSSADLDTSRYTGGDGEVTFTIGEDFQVNTTTVFRASFVADPDSPADNEGIAIVTKNPIFKTIDTISMDYSTTLLEPVVDPLLGWIDTLDPVTDPILKPDLDVRGTNGVIYTSSVDQDDFTRIQVSGDDGSSFTMSFDGAEDGDDFTFNVSSTSTSTYTGTVTVTFPDGTEETVDLNNSDPLTSTVATSNGLELDLGNSLTNTAAGEEVSYTITGMKENFDTIRIDTQPRANAAIATITEAIDIVSGERAKMGAVQNRLEHIIGNIGNSMNNLMSAESKIRDINMAQEMMKRTKSNILTQTAHAMMTQANQKPESVLQLLQ